MNATQEVRIKRRYTPRKPVVRTCQWCSSPFETTSYAAKFCTSSCKDRARYAKHRDTRLALVQKYRQENADAIKQRARERRRADPAKVARQNRESYLRHREKRIAEAAVYQRENPQVVALTRNRRRTAERFKVTQRDHRRMLERFRHSCAYCEVRLAPWGRANPNSLQWDHVLPLSRGGRDSIGNLIPACRDCNSNKSARLLVEWAGPNI